MKISESFD